MMITVAEGHLKPPYQLSVTEEDSIYEGFPSKSPELATNQRLFTQMKSVYRVITV